MSREVCAKGGPCDGHGTVWVDPGYPERLFPLPAAPLLGATDEEIELYAARCVDIGKRRLACRESVYPCPVCEPDRHARWEAGHHDPGHVRERCPECRTATGGTK